MNRRLQRNAVAPSGEPTDADLARAAKSGDRIAFGRLWERFAPVVHGTLLAHAKSTEVPDLMQEVSLLTLRAIGSLEDVDRVAGWIRMITVNRVKDFWKAQRRPTESDAIDDIPAPPIGEASDDRSAKILDHIRSLPDTYREVLILRLVEGLSGPEIADRTDLSPGSVRVTLCRGMKLLRAALVKDDLI